MKLIEKIQKKLFTELEIITQRQVEDCSITRFKVFGTIRPRVYIDGRIKIDVNAEVYNGKNNSLNDSGDGTSYRIKKITVVQLK